jgi:hypothetical protein
MKVTFQSLDNPQIFSSNGEQAFWRFNVSFQAERCSGEGYAYGIASPRSADWRLGAAKVVGRMIDLPLFYEKAFDFSPSPSAHDQIVPLGPRGSFRLFGEIAGHLRSGCGSVVAVHSEGIVIGVSSVPEDALELEPATRVSFRPEGFGFYFGQ